MIEIRKGMPIVTFSLFKKAGGIAAAVASRKGGVSEAPFDSLAAAVASRKGGVSEAPFDSLNMSFSAGDDPAAVRENRRRFLTLLGADPKKAVSCHQVHGTDIFEMGRDDAGRGALSAETAVPACDGLITREKGLPLTMNFADCTPLLFYDPEHRAAGIAHGGWRGTAGDIAGKTVRLMLL